MNIIDEFVEFGFTLEEQKVVSGIYANMIEYLCSLVEEKAQEYEQGSEYEERQLDYCLFLPIF